MWLTILQELLLCGSLAAWPHTCDVAALDRFFFSTNYTIGHVDFCMPMIIEGPTDNSLILLLFCQCPGEDREAYED